MCELVSTVARSSDMSVSNACTVSPVLPVGATAPRFAALVVACNSSMRLLTAGATICLAGASNSSFNAVAEIVGWLGSVVAPLELSCVFVIFVNDKQLMHFSYTRYLENKIRDTFGFKGTSLRFIIRERKENE